MSAYGERSKAITRFFAYLSHLVCICVLLFVAANLLSLLVFRAYPRILLPEDLLTTYNYLARFSGQLKPYRDEWFGLQQGQWESWEKEVTKRLAVGLSGYEDFTMFRMRPCKGLFFSFSEHGFRNGADQGPWPPGRDYCNIFVFGGSTTMGTGPDWTTVPSRLQEYLNDSGRLKKPVRVYNFGRGSYFSTQERILFQNLLLAGRIPDGAIFLNGLNDFYFTDGRPSGWNFFERSFSEGRDEALQWVANRTSARPKWQKLGQFIRSLPVWRAGEILGRRLFSPSAATASPDRKYKPAQVSESVLREVIRRHLENARQAEAVAHAYGVSTAFVVQPVPGYKYDMKYHIALDPLRGLGRHERSGYGYPIMRSIVKRNPLKVRHFIWAADITENRKEPLYLDAVHYTAEFSKILAKYIADRLIADDFFPKDVLPVSALKTEPSGANIQEEHGHATAN